nr:hypothetical protein [Yersinia pestis]
MGISRNTVKRYLRNE